MAENKKSFLLYTDLISTVSKLTDQKAGKLFKTILQYVNDLNPEVDDLLLQVAFEPIKQQLKRDLKDWEAERSKRSKAGHLGGVKSGESRRSRSKRSSASKNEANEADNVTVTVTDNVNDNVIKRDRNENVIYSIEHCLTVAMNDDRWVRVNKVTEYHLKEFNKVLEKQGVYEKNPKDYKTHYANWIKKANIEIKPYRYVSVEQNPPTGG